MSERFAVQGEGESIKTGGKVKTSVHGAPELTDVFTTTRTNLD